MVDEDGCAVPGSAKYDLGCLIGNISEGFYYCSYNDDDVFCAWKNKSLNDHWHQFMTPIEHERCGTMPELWLKYYPEDQGKFDWEGLFDRIFELAQGWPTGWLCSYETLEQLATQPNYQYDQHR